MKILIALLLTTLCAAAQSTVNFAAGPGQRDVRLATGQPVMTGTASVGFFEGDVWHQYGITDFREIFGEPGRFAGTAHSVDPIFTGQQIFLRLDAGFTSGLYTSDLEHWVFPDPFAVPPSNTTSINSSEVNQIFYGFANSGSLILVPEPTTKQLVMFFGGAFLGFLAVRKFYD
jgi:hypothetical protein